MLRFARRGRFIAATVATIALYFILERFVLARGAATSVALLRAIAFGGIVALSRLVVVGVQTHTIWGWLKAGKKVDREQD
jgi:hypothetical protein